MSRFHLSHAAALDLDEIDDYTIANFGVAQAIALAKRFRQSFERLSRHPESGMLRPELSPPGHEFRYSTILNRFTIVYDASPEGIRIARVLHGARDLGTELDRDAGDQ